MTAAYQLTASDIVTRTTDGAWIPNDPGNMDRVAYEQWLADGGVPDPYVPPPEAPPEIATQTTVLADHEQRIRALEQQAAVPKRKPKP
jgi:hypothetical protein